MDVGTCRGEILEPAIALKIAIDFSHVAVRLSESFVFLHICGLVFYSDSDNRGIKRKSKWKVIAGNNRQEMITFSLGTVFFSCLLGTL